MSTMSTPTPLPMGPDITKKPAAALALGSGTAEEPLSGKPNNSPGDKANLVSFWRNQDAGEIYRRVELITMPITPCLVQHARLFEAVTAAKKPLEVIDMCSGTGVVSSYIHSKMREMEPAEREKVNLTIADSSEAQLGVVKQKIAKEGWLKSQVVQADIMDLPFPSDHFDIIIVAGALMLVADPYTALKECYRVTNPGGTVATSTWVTEGWIPDTRDAVASLCLPGQAPVCWPQTSLELTRLWGPGAWEEPTFAKSMFTAAGFVDVEVEVVTKQLLFSGVDEWCYIFQAFMRAVTERFWTKEQKEKLQGELMPTIKAFLEKKYKDQPFEYERTILMAKGRKPEL